MGHRLRFRVKLGPTLSVAGGLLLAATPARPQYTAIGPSKCVACHDHDRQAAKWQKEEPAALGVKAHFNTRKQLDGAKAATFAKAIGLADPYDLKGSCVKCHATVFRGDANAGVSCESCHGPASGYLDLHQVKGSYLKSVAAGLKDLREKPAVIARLCVECHVASDRRLAAAGHPSGSTFDAGANLQKVVHWTAAYNYAQVTAAGKAAMPRANPAPAVSSAVAPGSPAVVPAPATAAPAPWDWDQPIRPLPKEYVPEPLPEPGGGTRPRPPAAVPPSIAEDTPLPRSAPGVIEVNAVRPALQATFVAELGVRSAAARVAELRGRGVVLLERLLRAGARAPDLPPAARPAEFRGPDSELFRLQDEVTALALEALRRPP
jgi:hypothetical protein